MSLDQQWRKLQDTLDGVSKRPTVADWMDYDTWVVNNGSSTFPITLPTGTEAMNKTTKILIANQANTNQVVVLRPDGLRDIGVIQGTQMMYLAYIHGKGYFATSTFNT